jgi:phenylacetate-CoA ligase
MPGELVFTSLTKEAMPVIRYRTRDLTRLLPPTARSMRRMGRITGRSDDMLIIRGVNVFPTQIEELLLGLQGLTPHYILEVTRESHLDSLTVKVECVRELLTDSAARARLGQQLRYDIKEKVGVTAQVTVSDPGSIERSMGKARRVIDKRQPTQGRL